MSERSINLYAHRKSFVDSMESSEHLRFQRVMISYIGFKLEINVMEEPRFYV